MLCARMFGLGQLFTHCSKSLYNRNSPEIVAQPKAVLWWGRLSQEIIMQLVLFWGISGIHSKEITIGHLACNMLGLSR